MTYVLTESCIRCKYTDCVDILPGRLLPGGAKFSRHRSRRVHRLHAVLRVPVEAIFAEDDVPQDQQHFVALNAELAKQWKPIVERKDALPDADEWAKIKAKLGELLR